MTGDDLDQVKTAIRRVQKLMVDVCNGQAALTPELATQAALVLQDALSALDRLTEQRPSVPTQS